MIDEPRKGLGRGLSALLGEEAEPQTSQERERATHAVPIEQVAIMRSFGSARSCA